MIVSSLSLSCNGRPLSNPAVQNQNDTSKLVGGGCEGCELMYVGMPEKITSENISNGWLTGRQKLMLTGKVFEPDGKTAAPNVIIYYWHTNDQGLYSPGKQTSQAASAHGELRGWVKSDENGNYKIKTSRPAPYPAQNIPQHIHLSIKEPGIANEYYADLYFDDDPLYLKHKKKHGQANRAGTEILRVLLDSTGQVAEHNIILGLNIPGYPAKSGRLHQSGLEIGEDNPSFMPYHAFGPDKGTTTCPVCKYGRFHGVVYFVGNHPDWEDIKSWLGFLEQESIVRKDYLKTYFVYGNEKNFSPLERKQALENIGSELGLKNIALTFVPSMTDTATEVYLNKINPAVKNTFVIYKHRTIIDKFINLEATASNFKTISSILDKTQGVYFHLPEPAHQ